MAVFVVFGSLRPVAQVHYVIQLCYLLSHVPLNESFNLCVPVF